MSTDQIAIGSDNALPEEFGKPGIPGSFFSRVWGWARRSAASLWSGSIGGMAMAVPVLGFLSYTFITSVRCVDGVLGCSFVSFGVIFPMHLIFSSTTFQDLSSLTFLLYYAVCSVAYLYSAYRLGAAVERWLMNAGNLTVEKA